MIEKIKQQKILVLGDLMLDEFVWGRVSRISPEAPVPVVRVTRDSAYPGGAANVARNLSDFGLEVTVSGLLGRDANGEKLKALLHEGRIATHGVLALDDFSTIVKTRIIARQQQVVRVDRETKYPVSERTMARLLPLLEEQIADADAVILEDYGKGFIHQRLVDEVLRLAGGGRKLVSADPNPNNPLQWNGVSLIKPNRQEAFNALGLPDDEGERALLDAGAALLQKWRVRYLLITLGEEGMILFHPPEQPYHTPTRAREVYDVSGAGDTAIAFFTAALSAGASGAQAAEIANHAAGVVVGKLGTATLTADELIKSLLADE